MSKKAPLFILLDNIVHASDTAPYTGAWDYLLFIIFFILSLLYILSLKRQKRLTDKLEETTETLKKQTVQCQLDKEQVANAEKIARFGSYRLDLTTDSIIWSEGHYRILGLDQESFQPTPESFMQFVHPGDKEMVEQKIQEILTTNPTSPTSFTYRFINHNGEKGYIQSTSSITKRDNMHRPLEIVGITLDVTQQVAYETELKNAEKALSTAQQLAGLGSWEIDLKTQLLTLSKEHRILIGEEPVETTMPMIEHTRRYVLEEDIPLLQERMAYAIDHINDTSYKDRFEYRKKVEDGSYEYFAVMSVFKSPGVVYGVTQNITDIKKAQKLLQLQNRELSQAKKAADIATEAKSLFLANMSHEIRTPLNAINGFISLLKDEEKDPEKLQLLQTITSASDTLLHTIDDILDFSKIENGKLDISMVDFQPYSEIITTAELFQKKASEKNIKLNLELSELPEVLYSDIFRIKQIINNLLSNAVKFTKENGHITLTCRYTEGQLYVSVKDDGIGVPLLKQKRVFDAFTQAEESTVREYGGSGLGLSISAQLVELLGGRLELKSVDGEGSEFFFTLPVKKGKKVQRHKEKALDLSSLQGKVLIVEDTRANQMFFELLLNKNGLQYDLANDGLEAVEKFKSGSFDLILMDENMPRMSGSMATQEIRKIEKEQGLKHTPIIALTANALKGDKERFIDIGMDAYLSKPVEPQELLETLYRFLTHKSASD